jgi:hypothetical protein
MQYSQLKLWDQQRFIAFVAITISVVVAMSMPVKAITIQQAIINGEKALQKNFDATIASSIAGLEQNEKDMAALNKRLNDAGADVQQALLQTRDQISSYIAAANDIKDKAGQLVQQGAEALNRQLQTTAVNVSDTVTKDVQGFVSTGNAIVDQARQMAQQGAEQLNKLGQSAAQFTQEQVANITAAINNQISVANDIIKKVGAQVAAGTAFIADAAKNAGAAITKAATDTIQGFVNAGTVALNEASDQVTAGVQALQDRVASDLNTLKNAVKIDANSSGVSVKVDLGNGIVAYSGISIPPEVAAKLEAANKKARDTLTALRKDIQEATDPAVITAKIKTAVKQINDAAVAGVYARTAKAVSSQVTVMDALQVSANALQVQVNKLQDCLKQSSSDAECATLRTDENSADQGASVQDSLSKIRTNIDTVRAFLSSSVNLVSLLKNDDYRGTIESLTAMTTMMSSVSILSSDLRNHLANLSSAINK